MVVYYPSMDKLLFSDYQSEKSISLNDYEVIKITLSNTNHT